MLRSMTGYGRGECIRHNRRFIVEIKSVNHRYNDISIKIPRVLACYEEPLKKILSAEISRGKTDVYISFESYSEEDVKINLNEALADAYVGSLVKIKERYHLADAFSLSDIIQFPDILTIEKNIGSKDSLQQMWESLSEAAALALSGFIAMRQEEGAALKEDIETKLFRIAEMVDCVERRSPLVAQEYRQKLLARVTEAMSSVNLDEARLLTEVTLFADRACIDEEITRLSSHISQMKAILNEPDAIGRKLDFLTQEMNREVNTIGSKSNDLEITKLTVDLKSELEKIREQVQNIE